MNLPKLSDVLPSNWAGSGMRLVIGESCVNMQFACAEGEITQKLQIDEHGNFSANGVYIRQNPGPLRVDSPPKHQSARYEGKISDKTMTLKITLTETNEVIGDFTLELNKKIRLQRCL